jgi:cytidylate kinase
MSSCETRGRHKLIVAIDGPSGAGKSSVTKALADRLGYIHIDTGAMFRTVALFVSRLGIDPDDDTALDSLCSRLSIEFDFSGGKSRVMANGEDVTRDIRTPGISLLTSKIAAMPSVRRHLLLLQQRMGARGGVVLEGRDIGTVVFPEAQVKFYLTASAEERGRRRYEELKEKGEDVSLQQTIAEVQQRDRQDLNREIAPLRLADDAVVIDTTDLTPEAVLSTMESLVCARENR